METLRKQGIPENLLSDNLEPFKTTYQKKNTIGATTCIFFGQSLATVLQQVLPLALALPLASEFENGTLRI
jgi:hypothetical protein